MLPAYPPFDALPYDSPRGAGQFPGPRGSAYSDKMNVRSQLLIPFLRLADAGYCQCPGRQWARQSTKTGFGELNNSAAKTSGEFYKIEFSSDNARAGNTALFYRFGSGGCVAVLLPAGVWAQAAGGEQRRVRIGQGFSNQFHFGATTLAGQGAAGRR